MTDQLWNMKLNYTLAYTICKYGLNPERWDLVANSLADVMNTTPSDCKAQFHVLCQQYAQNWNKDSNETLDNHVLSAIKRLYYSDLCERMNESRDLVLIVFDFIRLFNAGVMKPNDINDILQDLKKGNMSGRSTQDSETELKIKILERLKSHMLKKISRTSNQQNRLPPVEVVLPPPFNVNLPSSQSQTSQESYLINEDNNDRQVPSVDNVQKSDADDISSYPVVTQPVNVFVEQELTSMNNNESHEVNIDEIELCSNDDDERIEQVENSTREDSVISTSLAADQDDSTYMSTEQAQLDEFSTTSQPPIEVSNSDNRDIYEKVISDSSESNQSTSNTPLLIEEQTTSSVKEPNVPAHEQPNTISTISNDVSTVDSDRIQLESDQDDQSAVTEPLATLSESNHVEDDHNDRMDTEPSSENTTHTAALNNNTDSVVIDYATDVDITKVSSPLKIEENNESTTTKSSRRKSRLTTSSNAQNLRKSLLSVLSNLKTAKYGSDFAKPLASFELPDNYYVRIKKPLDIPEIRDRLNNGDYDDNILLFERDVLLMFINALSMYNRDFDIHEHAQFMIGYAMELLSPLENAHKPWTGDTDKTEDDSSKTSHTNNLNDSNENISSPSSNAPTTTIESVSSSFDCAESTGKNLRRQTISNHPMPKRQRKTTH